MRFVVALVAAVLLAAPVVAQHRGSRPSHGRRPTYTRPVRPLPPRVTPPIYGRGGYRHHGRYAPPVYGYYGGYSPVGYGYYPGIYVDPGLETFLIRQRQDFAGVPLHSGWGPYGWQDGSGYGVEGSWSDEAYDPPSYPVRGNRYGSASAGGGPPPRSEYRAPRAPQRLKELVVDGVPTLVSEN